MVQDSLPWYHRRGWAFALLFFFPPLGIALLWWGQHLQRNMRIGLTVASALFFLGILAQSKPQATTRAEVSPVAEPKATPPTSAMPDVTPSPTAASQNSTGPEPVVPPYDVAEDVDLAPKKGHRILVNVREPDLTDAQCVAIVARLRPRAGQEGQVAVRIPLHNDQSRFFPLCVDNLDGQGVQESTARQMQRALDK
ncbi:MAG TPA: hypothetical protein VHN14_31040 [Kofleriaceae bacterium]|jgi:hypothetical protein|nr:hypothetical protein [Kofleriaceae bacterium]